MNEKGLTLIEVLASLVLLSIIVVSLLSFFTHSARSNNVSKSIMNATYTAEATMEEMYGVITSTKSLNELIKPTGYNEVNKTANRIEYQKKVSSYSLTIVLTSTTDPSLVNLKVKAYKDTKIEAQMEMLVAWKKE
jgi:prepilin-type N-terminal cleavage/methylation domain-containing protein